MLGFGSDASRGRISLPASRQSAFGGVGKTMTISPLDNPPVNVRVRLSLMWAVIMFFYIYNDVFMLLGHVRSGAEPSAGPANEITMLLYALVITPAALMPLLCLVFPPALTRWVNIVLGTAYVAIIFWTLAPASTALFYRFIGVVENIVTLAVIWTAWRWPRTARSQ